MTPEKEQIIKVRLENNLTQKECASLIRVSIRTWQHYEAGDRKMHWAFWQCFLTEVQKLK